MNDSFTIEQINKEIDKINKCTGLYKLSDNNLSDLALKTICLAIKANKNITSLDLSNNNITGNSSIVQILNIFKDENNIVELNLSNNPLGISSALLLLKNMSENKAIRKLLLANCGLDDSKSQALTFMGNNTNLEELDLNGNLLGDNALIALKSFYINSKIKSIELANNNITDIGAKCIGAIISENTTSITRLNLQDNKIEDEGAFEIAEGLRTNKSITEVNLTNNIIADRGVIAIADTLAEDNNSITKLFLDNNLIIFSGIKELSKAIDNNDTLEVISCSNNPKDESLINNNQLMNLYLEGQAEIKNIDNKLNNKMLSREKKANIKSILADIDMLLADIDDISYIAEENINIKKKLRSIITLLKDSSNLYTNENIAFVRSEFEKRKFTQFAKKLGPSASKENTTDNSINDANRTIAQLRETDTAILTRLSMLEQQLQFLMSEMGAMQQNIGELKFLYNSPNLFSNVDNKSDIAAQSGDQKDNTNVFYDSKLIPKNVDRLVNFSDFS